MERLLTCIFLVWLVVVVGPVAFSYRARAALCVMHVVTLGGICLSSDAVYRLFGDCLCSRLWTVQSMLLWAVLTQRAV